MECKVNYDLNQSRRSLKRCAKCNQLFFQISRKLQRIDEEEDRISCLPDVILSDILSLLPTKVAVATSVLSKRWRHVFSGITCLNFDASPISHCDCSIHMTHRYPIFLNFVENVLEACQSDNISTFRLNLAHPIRIVGHECNRFCFPAVESLHLTRWLRFPLTRLVRELDLCIHVRYPTKGKLPSQLFCCGTLEVLRVSSNLMLEFPDPFCLPNLKVLHLSLYDFPEGHSVTRLVSSCPSLEDLALEGELTDGDSLVISAPCLRRLGVVTYITPEHAGVRKVVLETPELEYLEYAGSCALEYSIANMNALVEAHLHIQWSCDVNLDDTLLRLLTSVSHVHTLSLMYDCVQGLEMCAPLQPKLPVFHNLRHLFLGCDTSLELRSMLLDVLDCSPFLEKLVFPEGFGVNDGDMGDEEMRAEELKYWSTVERVPSCLRLHLRSVVIECFDESDMSELSELGITMVEYFLRSASLLEELVVGYSDPPMPLMTRLQSLQSTSVKCCLTFRPTSVGRIYPFSHSEMYLAPTLSP